MESDPISLRAGLNTYIYVALSPIIYADSVDLILTLNEQIAVDAATGAGAAAATVIAPDGTVVIGAIG